MQPEHFDSERNLDGQMEVFAQRAEFFRQMGERIGRFVDDLERGIEKAKSLGFHLETAQIERLKAYLGEWRGYSLDSADIASIDIDFRLAGCPDQKRFHRS